MEKIPTAIEYKDYFTEKMELEPEYYNDYIDKMMIEFAKLHVEQFAKSNLNAEKYLKLHVK